MRHLQLFGSVGAGLCMILSSAGCRSTADVAQAMPTTATQGAKTPSVADKIVRAARTQVGKAYTQEYFSLKYPGGDVPADRGACTDVIIRALRAVGHDLQKLMHEDMSKNFAQYPSRKKWGLKRTDKNIDHRRVPNQMVFFKRFGSELTKDTSSKSRSQWRAGDIVCWDLNGNNMTHTGIVSDKQNAQGWPLVIHNIGGGREDDSLNAWKIIGHFRYPK